MALILSIETATDVCSVTLSRDREIIAARDTSGSNEHSALLTVFIEEVIKEAGIAFNRLDAIAVSMGPGSYTGLRIGVSAAKGLCYALNLPLISVSTLKALAFEARNRFSGLLAPGTLICPMIDARRMEVYAALYDLELNEISHPDALILDEFTFGERKGIKIAIVGNGVDKCRDLYANNPDILFPGHVRPSASAVGMLAQEKFSRGEFENTAYFEPYYLKDFIAGKPKVKGLH